MAQVIEMEDVKASFARRLRARRKELDLTQQQAAALVKPDLALRTYQSWEDPKDSALPDGANAWNIEITMGVSLVDPADPRKPATARYVSQPEWGMAQAASDLVLSAS